MKSGFLEIFSYPTQNFCVCLFSVSRLLLLLAAALKNSDDAAADAQILLVATSRDSRQSQGYNRSSVIQRPW